MTGEEVQFRAPFPVRVDAELDGGLSRWLWLVKWILVIPHVVVLVFLWLAFVVLSLVAFVAIVFTGRYPRALFDFNVGVLRWTWRVSYYSYGALATDRYPPFRLAEMDDYPAHLHVPYPDHLSRGLVWVKTWLLAIPHYLVIGFFVGGGSWVIAEADEADQTWVQGGLIGLLALIGAVVLLFRDRYPTSVFELVLGMNRWVLRVAAYAALMTDTYPPFRLDQGGTDPGTMLVQPPQPPHTGQPTPPIPAAAGGSPGEPEEPGTEGSPLPAPLPPARGSQWTAGRVVAVVLGILSVLMGLGALGGGVTAMVADQVLRDDEGFITSPNEDLATSTVAIVSDPVDLHSGDGPDAFYADRLLGDVRFRATPAASDTELFVGVAPTADVDDYLLGVPHVIVTDISDGEASYIPQEGTEAASPPAGQDFWLASVEGTGEQILDWPLEDGQWTLVVMNADASPGIDVEVDIGAEVPVLTTVAWVLLIVGVVLATVGVVLILVSARRAGQRRAAMTQASS